MLAPRLGHELPGHVVDTVQQAGWSGVKNGELLGFAAGRYDVFVTIDKLLAAQQSVPPQLAVITLHAQNNRLATLLPLVAKLREALAAIQPGEVRRLGV